MKAKDWYFKIVGCRSLNYLNLFNDDELNFDYDWLVKGKIFYLFEMMD